MLTPCANSLTVSKRDDPPAPRPEASKSFYRDYSASNLWGHVMKMFSPNKVCIEVYCDRDGAGNGINSDVVKGTDRCEICYRPIDTHSQCHVCGLPKYAGEYNPCSRYNSCELNWREEKKKSLSMSSPIAICCPSQKLIQKVKHKKKTNLSITKPLCCAITPSPKSSTLLSEDYGDDECKALAYILFLLVSFILYLVFSYQLDWWPFPISFPFRKEGRRFSLGCLRFR